MGWPRLLKGSELTREGQRLTQYQSLVSTEGKKIMTELLGEQTYK